MLHPKDIKIADYTYALPNERIAHYPLAERDTSKLLVYEHGNITDDNYNNITNYLPANSLIVFNQTKVVNARLLFKKPSGGIIEVFCLSPHHKYADMSTAMMQKDRVLWQCLVGGAAKWKQGVVLRLDVESREFTLSAVMKERYADGTYTIELSWDKPEICFAEILHEAGKVPLPPYLNRESKPEDEQSYQTIFAEQEGSVAAPTAGLHFTDRILKSLASKNIQSTFLTLHVGAGTFMPVKSETMQGHAMHTEWIEVNKATIEQLATNLDNNITAVGTTSLRTLESLYWIGVKLAKGRLTNLNDIALTQWEPYELEETTSAASALHAIIDHLNDQKINKLVTRTQLLITPAYRFRIVDTLVTNFHQPKSTLLLLVAAFIGDDWRRVYDHALQNHYRFLSYGDGCILKKSSFK